MNAAKFILLAVILMNWEQWKEWLERPAQNPDGSWNESLETLTQTDNIFELAEQMKRMHADLKPKA